jgi:Methyltransferase domain
MIANSSLLNHLPESIYRPARKARRGVRNSKLWLQRKTHFDRGAAYGARFVDRQPPPIVHSPGRIETYFNAHQTGPGIWKWQHYFDIYERHFAKLVGRPIDVVEIGVFSGGSFMMWRDYFGSDAELIGTDIEPACRVYEGEKIRVFIGDQADTTFWDSFLREVPAFDVVIDDGGHQSHQQIPTLEALLPHIRPGGVYLCEDIYGPNHYFHDYIAGLSRQLHEGDFNLPLRFDANVAQRAIDSIHIYPLVTVIEKRSTMLHAFAAPQQGTDWQPNYDEAAGHFTS